MGKILGELDLRPVATAIEDERTSSSQKLQNYTRTSFSSDTSLDLYVVITSGDP